MSNYRVLFLGQKPVGEAAWAILDEIDDEFLDIVACVTNKDSDAVWWGSNRIAESVHDISVIDTNTRNNDAIQSVIAQENVDLIICVHHPYRIPPSVLDAVDYNAITFHNAKLPKYKGHNAVNHAILNGDTEFASTAHWMADELDEGNIIYEGYFTIADCETALSLYAKANHAALVLLKRILDDLLDNRELPDRPVSGEGAFYSRDSIEGLREIQDLERLDTKSRAFFFPPFEPAYLRDGSKKNHVIPETATKTLTEYGSRIRQLHDDLLDELEISVRIE